MSDAFEKMVVMDRGLAVDHARLLGRNWRAASNNPTEVDLKTTKT